MTYCVERTKLLSRAGRELATSLLPAGFGLWHEDHSTGIQMTIVTAAGGQTPLPVWKGSVWHSSIYEFNDNGAIPGLQPDFDFAREAIEAYFARVQAAVEQRDAERALLKDEREAAEQANRQSVIDAARSALAEQEAANAAPDRG